MAIWNAMISFAIVVLAPVVLWTGILSVAASGLGYTLSTAALAGVATAIGCFLSVIWAVLFIAGRDESR